MNIVNLRRASGEGGAVALFDLEVSPDIRLLNWALKRTANGWASFPPTARTGTPSAKAPLHIREQITAAATAAYNGGRLAHDSTR